MDAPQRGAREREEIRVASARRVIDGDRGREGNFLGIGEEQRQMEREGATELCIGRTLIEPGALAPAYQDNTAKLRDAPCTISR